MEDVLKEKLKESQQFEKEIADLEQYIIKQVIEA